MAAQSIASRPRRPQQAEPDDAILARVLQFTEWARRNVVIVVGVVVALAVLIGGLLWWRADRAQRLENAAIEFLQVEQAVLSGDEGIATQQLQVFIQEHSGTPYADEARVLLAQVHLRGDRAAQAIEVLTPLAAQMDDSPVGVQAALLLASAQQAAEDDEAAIQTYLNVADESEVVFRQQEALVGAALLRQESSDWAGAAELYRRLVETTEEGSTQRAVFEMRLAEAEAQAQAS
ncbi:MAG: tetratricopeptide repeat protein [Gemmatimonas sp.]|nr:tetratricopeptide repeat protein [Gemmatimonas sp.]